MKTKGKRACPVCGALFTDSESCPVCALRGALGNKQSASESPTEPTLSPSQLRLEHYEILTREDGAPFELGRGAMGVTYKAVDINLRCAVALKVINTRWIGDELARRRFVREARAAASVRHPNVASVFHLGKRGDSYFYAMEFVEGETLQSLIKRSGRLDVNLALEIATQVVAGLAAVHKQKLIHRDLKPSNIMVSLEDGGAVAAKIIDLGLAKAVKESASDAEISTGGAFAGTPEFASPEQFAGVGADIRSDLYSLGVVLWEMLTGKVPFNGSVAEVMYQHVHKSAPVELLKDIPQPVIVLLEVLLEKDPTQRFQTPNELLNAMPTVMRSIKAKRTIKPQELRATFVHGPSSRQEKSPAIRAQKRSIAVLPFDTLSQGKGKTYFADGVQDEILSNLAKVSQLKVISRTSVMTFRPEVNRNLRSIAESLGVANVVEGTVRRDGNRVRITIRLVDARTDKALWSESYDRELRDIFAIQSEIAQAVASKLSARLSPEEKNRIEAKPTEDLAAYDLYLRGKELVATVWATYASGNVEKPLRAAIDFFDQAVQIDPKFTLAYCALAQAHNLLYSWYDPTPEQRASADAALNSALGLQPDLPEVHLTQAYHIRFGGDYERAREELTIARRGLPNDSRVILLEASIDNRQGNPEKTMQRLQEASQRDPRNSALLEALALSLRDNRQFRAAEQTYARLIELLPNQPMLELQVAEVSFRETGDDTAAWSALAALPASLTDERDVVFSRLRYAFIDRNWTQAKELIDKMKGAESNIFAYVVVPVPIGCYYILLARLQGEQSGEDPSFAQTRTALKQKVQKSPANALLLSNLAVVDALLGHKDASIVEAKRAVEMLPISKDAVLAPRLLLNLAVVYAWTNELDLAFENLAALTKTPGGIFYGWLKCDPYWDPLRADPRYEKLLAELAPQD